MNWIPYSESNHPDYYRRVVLVGFEKFGTAEQRPCTAIAELRPYAGWVALGILPEKIVAWCYEEEFARDMIVQINYPVTVKLPS